MVWFGLMVVFVIVFCCDKFNIIFVDFKVVICVVECVVWLFFGMVGDFIVVRIGVVIW